MARPLTKLLAHDCEFKWTNQCDISLPDAERHALFSTHIEVPPIQPSRTHCTQMQASMDGQEYSLRVTLQP